MYHVNPNTGEFGICHAKSSESCPFGCENHSENLNEIQIKADKINKQNRDYQSLEKMKVFNEIYNSNGIDNELKSKGINSNAYYYYENSRDYNKKYIDIDRPFSDMNKEIINNIVDTYREQGIKEFSISSSFSDNPKFVNDFVNAGASIDRIEILKDKNKEYTAFVLKVDKPRENDIIKIEDEGIKSFNREFYDKKTGKFDYDKLFFDEEYNKKADTNFAFSFYRRGIANDNKLEHINLGDGMYSFLRDNNNVKKVIQSFKDNNIKTFSVSSGYSDNPSYIKSFVDNGAKIVDVGKLVNGKETFILEV